MAFMPLLHLCNFNLLTLRNLKGQVAMAERPMRWNLRTSARTCPENQVTGNGPMAQRTRQMRGSSGCAQSPGSPNTNDASPGFSKD
ncbi:hypothetical protein M419DRAFT_131954 [Trichoderma reesei RUT C-30]|uniref:Uncharacterized protein n=1 Tax=Hypocrea jecorina (strain ATCC 56765 / BCRC 32924 / NRRL 11460 / Rut C-30) TaxID=1344414 RepID=A0A024S3M1_HYPJR|nr:hypothetical protein M419DRAFT_131954 [Trichoderma reesei RUT C-30]